MILEIMGFCIHQHEETKTSGQSNLAKVASDAHFLAVGIKTPV